MNELLVIVLPYLIIILNATDLKLYLKF